MSRPENNQSGIRKLSLVGKKTYAVSLPIDTVKILQWRKGDNLQVRRQGNKIIIEKLPEEQ